MKKDQGKVRGILLLLSFLRILKKCKSHTTIPSKNNLKKTLNLIINEPPFQTYLLYRFYIFICKL
jgi:hypothetical protein